ncbi:MAG: ubiquinol-cytochrome c reductase iron-sulfur subunit [Chloroflexi bacterium]|nr:ubiquinol-cytochrome c reductase iron-sulfur subunit [Chloroflexota bacterium]
MSNETHKVTRRNFLAQGIGACVAFLATLLGIPAIGAAVGPAFRRTEADWTPMGKAERFPVGVPTAADFSVSRKDGWLETTESKAVWVVRHSATDFVVFNGRCTHLGCAYRWQADKNQFVCPCHAGIFSIDGDVLSGPPPRGLDSMPSKVEAGDLLVQYVDYRLGVEQKVPS